MRDFEVRAWLIESKKMIYPVFPYIIKEETEYSNYNGAKTYLSNGLILKGYRQYSCYGDYVLMFYTGVKDKVGQKTFAGDIVKLKGYWAVDDNDLVVVKWGKDSCGFEPFCIFDRCTDSYYKGSDCEVVGNIHENPELLKG